MRLMRDVQGKEMFMFNSGDIVDCTGLAGATPIDGQDILPIIRQVCVCKGGWMDGRTPSHLASRAASVPWDLSPTEG